MTTHIVHITERELTQEGRNQLRKHGYFAEQHWVRDFGFETSNFLNADKVVLTRDDGRIIVIKDRKSTISTDDWPVGIQEIAGETFYYTTDARFKLVLREDHTGCQVPRWEFYSRRPVKDPRFEGLITTGEWIDFVTNLGRILSRDHNAANTWEMSCGRGDEKALAANIGAFMRASNKQIEEAKGLVGKSLEAVEAHFMKGRHR